MISETLEPILCEIFNQSLTLGILPKLWYEGMIIPIPKKSNCRNPSDTRPISLTPIFAKIREKILDTRLRSVILNKLKAFQRGFRAKENIFKNIRDLISMVKNALDDKKVAAVLLLDIQKAFDTVDRNALLEKIKSYGINGKFL